MKKNGTDSNNISSMIQQAKEACKNAYAPYSKHKVGACVKGKNGKVYSGVNVENASYPQGWCAEASAISAMVLDGETTIESVVITNNMDVPCPPCGGCRQKILEFSHKNTKIYTVSGQEIAQEYSIEELIPHSFSDEHLPDNNK